MADPQLTTTLDYRDAWDILGDVLNKNDNQLSAYISGQTGLYPDVQSAQSILEDMGYVKIEGNGGVKGWCKYSDISYSYTDLATIDSNGGGIFNGGGNPVRTIVEDPDGGGFKISDATIGNVATFAANVANAAAAAGVGISLGKVIDSTLYNLNPDFWDDIGLSTLNPDTWNTITQGDDSFAAGLFNMIFGLNPNTGEGSYYIDQNAFAYLASYMFNKGVFNTGEIIINPPPEDFPDWVTTQHPLTDVESVPYSFTATAEHGSYPGIYYLYSGDMTTNDSDVFSIGAPSNYNSFGAILASKNSQASVNFHVDVFRAADGSLFRELDQDRVTSNSYTYDNKTVYFTTAFLGYVGIGPRNYSGTWDAGVDYDITNNTTYNKYYAWQAVYGTTQGGGGVDGITNQTGATQPNTSTWYGTATPEDIANILSSLQSQYPDLFNNAITSTSIQPAGTTISATQPYTIPDNSTITIGSGTPTSLTNGTTVTTPSGEVITITDGLNATIPTGSTISQPNTTPQILTEPATITTPSGFTQTTTYIPIAIPTEYTAPDVKTQPITDGTDFTQTDTKIDFDDDAKIDDLLQTIIESILKQTTGTPPITGTGDTPSIPAPDGESSALWSVYHPTQSEVDAFGGWLWTGNIITQIQQLLQNPMDGIITLHKIFATPVDSGTSTIVVGRLDSQVSSATVNQQYVQVDCGSVNCYEQFGNVFDYNLTKVSLYLPFIGIVPLNVDDVMRSTISITYGVDVFTGACLAMVEVTRDGCTANLYQYAGVASVEYPVTGAVHSGLLNGIFGIAGGVVGAVAASSGVGIAAGVGATASGLANVNKVANARSGGFSGNAGAMGIKTPYLIIERPQVRIAEDFPLLDGYPTNISTTIGECSGHVVCSTVHVSGIAATDTELKKIESLLKSGIEI